MRSTLAWALAAVEGGLWLLLIAASLHLVRLALWGLSQPRLADEPAPPLPADPPLVTVQLPMRNERDVAARLVHAVAALDWPRLQIQILDDSDDETSAILDGAAADLRTRGLDVTVLRRADRSGFKAGNLQHGLSSAGGAFLLVLDADAEPAPDLVRRLIAPLLADAELAFAQARWSFANERESPLTRLQAIILHALFTVEQARLTALRRPVQFNGTAGLWRTSALVAAGGWLGAGASVTEDLDLSYRVQLRGLRGATLPSVSVGTELPSSMRDLRAQQSRWVRGAGEVLRSLGRRLFAGSLTDGVSMLAHLVRHARQPLLLLLALALPASTLTGFAPARALPPGAWPIVLALTLSSVCLYHGAALRRLGRSAACALVTAPLVAALSVGLSFTLTAALVSGLLGVRGEWTRTPKRGAAGASSYAPSRTLRPVELLLGLAHLGTAVWLAAHGAWLPALGLAFFFAFGFLWVAF